ncbi:MAG TPA: DUF3105 domain-containing protein [Gaiellaceae bacterium]
MAKKARTPPPPRRVQAPQQRTAKPGDDLGARHRKILYGVSGAGAVLLVAVVLLIALTGGSSGAKAAATTIQNAGCRYKHYPELVRLPHYTTLTPSPPPHWNSFPPTSGRHYYQPIPFGIYTEVLPEIRLVHNLEHGAMILQYGSNVPKPDVQRITDWYQQDANAVVVAPLPKLGDKVAMTSWTQWAECTGFNEKAANAFRKAFRYHAPEHFPKSYLEPGQ